MTIHTTRIKSRLTLLTSWAICALLVIVVGCSDRSTPTSPAPLDTPPVVAQPTGSSSTPILLSRQNHPEGWQRTLCLVCHQPGLLAYHNDLDEPQCLGCHGDNGTDPEYELCVVCHGTPPATGAHHTHIALTGYGLDCDSCHRDAGIAAADKHRDGTVQVSIDPVYGGSFADSRCSNTVCHGIGSPHWTNDNELDCTECHDAAGTVSIGPFSGQHASHAANKLNCDDCHPEAPATHYNGSLDEPDNITPDHGRYQDTTPGGYSPTGTSGTCSGMGVPCHGMTAQWTAGETCGACHPATNSNPPTSGSHPRHTSSSELNYPCSWCHAAFPERHPDFRVDVVFASNSQPGDGSYAAGECFNIYCHGGGAQPLPPAGGADPMPIWGGTVACGDCHGAPGAAQEFPPTGEHDFHVDLLGYSCDTCHAAYPSEHANGERTVQFGPSWPDAVFTRADQPNHGSCGSVSCHWDFPTARDWQ